MCGARQPAEATPRTSGAQLHRRADRSDRPCREPRANASNQQQQTEPTHLERSSPTEEQLELRYELRRAPNLGYPIRRDGAAPPMHPAVEPARLLAVVP